MKRAKYFPCGSERAIDEVGGKILLGDNTEGEGEGRSIRFQSIAIWIYIYSVCVYVCVCVCACVCVCVRVCVQFRLAKNSTCPVS